MKICKILFLCFVFFYYQKTFSEVTGKGNLQISRTDNANYSQSNAKSDNFNTFNLYLKSPFFLDTFVMKFKLEKFQKEIQNDFLFLNPGVEKNITEEHNLHLSVYKSIYFHRTQKNIFDTHDKSGLKFNIHSKNSKFEFEWKNFTFFTRNDAIFTFSKSIDFEPIDYVSISPEVVFNYNFSNIEDYHFFGTTLGTYLGYYPNNELNFGLGLAYTLNRNLEKKLENKFIYEKNLGIDFLTQINFSKISNIQFKYSYSNTLSNDIYLESKNNIFGISLGLLF